ncbi:hypothetical protein [Embleya sp. NPDC020886]|uniref:hypothetical protein n=1 Tax=Embleya sp. NPDC020886 TaxID=3363980 RepID=UPI00378DE436
MDQARARAAIRFREPAVRDTAFRVREAAGLDTAFRVAEGLLGTFRESAFRGGAFAVVDFLAALRRTVPARRVTVRATGDRRDVAADFGAWARDAAAATVRSSTVSVSPLRWM